VRLVVSQDVLDEAERNLYRKAPQALRTFWAQREQFEKVAPTDDLVADVARLIESKDAPVVAGAITAGVTYLVTYDRRHLLNEAELIRREYRIEVVTPDHVVARLGEP
jgi:predicted nucleic acid-binding protein